MQLKNYSILSTKEASKLYDIRIEHSYGEKKDFLTYAQDVVDSHPNSYYMYKDLRPAVSPNLPYYMNHSSAVTDSHHVAIDECLNPDKYQIGIKNSATGHQKTLDRIYGGRAHLKFLTPKSSDKLFKAYSKGVDMSKRNNENTYEKSMIKTYRTLIQGRYYGNDIYSDKRRVEYHQGLAKDTQALHNRMNSAKSIGKTNLRIMNMRRPKWTRSSNQMSLFKPHQATNGKQGFNRQTVFQPKQSHNKLFELQKKAAISRGFGR